MLDIFTGLLVLVGAGQAVLFFWQLRMMRRSLADTRTAAEAAEKSAKAAEAGIAQARDTAERQLRAYLSRSGKPDCIELVQKDGSVDFEFRPPLMNDGLTPAYDVSATGWVTIYAFPLPPDPSKTPPEKVVPSIGDLGPRQQMRMLCPGIRRFTAQEVALVKAPGSDRRLYMVGAITYRDAFGATRRREMFERIEWDHDGKPYSCPEAGQNKAD